METVQFKVKASQARSIYHYRRLKIKVLKCNADIFFNKLRLIKKIVPNFLLSTALQLLVQNFDLPNHFLLSSSILDKSLPVWQF